jgi:hypothetical protein
MVLHNATLLECKIGPLHGASWLVFWVLASNALAHLGESVVIFLTVSSSHAAMQQALSSLSWEC